MLVENSALVTLYTDKVNITPESLIESKRMNMNSLVPPFVELIVNTSMVIILVGVVVEKSSLIAIGFSVFLLTFFPSHHLESMMEQREEMRKPWKRFSTFVSELSEYTHIPVNTLYELTEFELREIGQSVLRQLTEQIKNAEQRGDHSMKEDYRTTFRGIHNTLFNLGLAEGGWGKYFAH